MLRKKDLIKMLARIFAVFLVPSLVFTGNVSAEIKSIAPERSTLAAPTKMDREQTRKEFMLRASALTNAGVGAYISDEIKKYQGLNPNGWRDGGRVQEVDITEAGRLARNFRGNEASIAGFDRIKVIRIDDLFKKTLQFAHLGLQEKDDNGVVIPGSMPVIYIDSQYFEHPDTDNAAMKHEIDEAIQAYKFRLALENQAAFNAQGADTPKVDIRKWINDHMAIGDTTLPAPYANLKASEIWEKFHTNAYDLKALYDFVKAGDPDAFTQFVDLDYLETLYNDRNQEDQPTINIAAFGAQFDDVDTLPTQTAFYKKLKDQCARSAFGDQMVFGTSGIRDFVKFLEDIKCTAVAKAILSFMKSKGFLDLDQIVIASDLRPSSPRLMKNMIVAALEWQKTVLCAGSLPTPAVAYYGMYKGIPSAELTASHNPVFPEEQHGIKPNTKDGEVLKEDELEILKQVREFLELELMIRQELSKFTINGQFKDYEDLPEAQKAYVRAAIGLMGEMYNSVNPKAKNKREMPGQKNVHDEAVKMYIDRYVEAFGEGTFDATDKMAFLAHMTVGRDIMKQIFTRLGADFYYEDPGEDWIEGLIVDTEDINPKYKFKPTVMEISKRFKHHKTNLKGIWSADGDADRPALFDADGEFLYGDKLGGVTGEFIASLSYAKETVPATGQPRKKLAVLTETIAKAVEDKLADLGYEVRKVKIGSPYVVKEMEDWMKLNPDGIAIGFERNGGFLLGSDIILDNGKVLRKLATRDATLPMIAAFIIAKRANCTIGELFKKTYTDKYSCQVWSGLIGAVPAEYEGVSADDVTYCQQYTATIGQALMRSFSPMQFNIEEVEFVGKADGSGIEKIKYRFIGAADFTEEGPGGAIFERMSKIYTTLVRHYGADKGFDGIKKMRFLDGVRIFFNNGEVLHMRPSGNSPQWRIYSEAKDLKRAMEITDFRFQVYPAMIREYLESKKEFANVRMVPRDNADMRAIFDDFKTFSPNPADVWEKNDDRWVTWKMKFGGESEHRLEEGIDFASDNSTISFWRKTTYKTDGPLSWLVKSPMPELTISRAITWDRNAGTLTCTETWSDGRTGIKEVFKGTDAWLELGRALDKNIPMGKLTQRPFPVMTQQARDYFRQEGVMWLDLFDVAIEPEFTIEQPMWEHNFKFKKVTETDFTSENRDFLRLREGKDHMRAKIAEGYTYQIRYNESALKQYASAAGLSKESNPIQLINEYADGLRVCVGADKDPKKVVEVTPFKGKLEDGKPALISITCIRPDGTALGEGNVEIETLDKNLPLAMVRLLNMALAGAHIPKNADISKYPWLVAFIKAQYKILTGKDFIPDEKSNFWYMKLDKIKPIQVENLQSYYEQAILKFRQSA